MSRATDDLSDVQIRALLNRARTTLDVMELSRHRFAVWVLRQARMAREISGNRDRCDRARFFREYEHVGGPLDGKLIYIASPQLLQYSPRGYYELEKDHRFHYYELARSWFDTEQELNG